MKKLTLILMILVSVLSFGAEVAGVEVAEGMKVGEKELKLNGAGVRKKAFLSLYVGSLYTENRVEDSSRAVEGDEEMSVELHIVSGMISNDAMREAVEEGFDASTTVEERAVLNERIEGFIEVFNDEINKGDRFTFNYLPDAGVEVYKNGIHLTTVEGLDFKRALYGIWLGDKPADKNLKKAMLGR
ncbi:chalcone isomerase [Propionigenium maris DSM 9537]|uniref:Chalcone isomerase n=1 Tax=Propionigenium maris DSM 9537 TaxID=1123000 RepID=A0A9W6LNR8_9FUSO|nr:chalcone isomerase family protein [Propionigenium maris]GLI56867.1 chalcone isomerase [Propionigenium maris DSM 9537]